MKAIAEAGMCDYCGLPLPRSWRRRTNTPDNATEPQAGPSYCCVGCRIAAQVTREKGEEGAVRWMLAKLGLSIFFTMNVLVFSMALWSDDFYTVDTDRTTVVLTELFRYLSMLFAIPVLFLLGEPLLQNAREGFKRGVYSTDLLLLTGIVAAYLYSAISVFRGEGHVYFEVGCVVLVLVTLGRWMEAVGRLQSSAALSALEKLLPENVSIIRSGIDTTVPLSDVVVGDRLRVRPAERIPIDGRVESGTSTVDQQIVTGESWPVVCRPGDVLYGGTLNLDGEFVLQATAPAGEGVFRKLIEAVQSARASKGRYEQLSERAASLFLPVVVVVSLATFGFHAWFHGWEQGILSGLSVVLIACPCALGIATPMAVWSALGRAVQEQVLFKSSDALERLANVDRIYFDKTGTLTTGTPALVGFVTANPQLRDDALRFAALAAVNSTHPLSRVILEFARSGDVTDSAVSEAVATANSSVSHPKTLVFPGRGVVVERSEHLPEIYLGSRRFLAGAGFRMNGFFEAQYESAMDHGNPVVLVAWDECVKGLFKFEEMTRAEARETIRECRSLDLKLLVLTGDHDSRASYLAAQLGLQVESELLPNDKMERVAAARTRGGLVAMVGDGVNDAPALAASDIGIALGCGADISRESADVCLLSNDLSRIPWTVRLARATVRTIRVNLFWAFAYNVVGIILAATGWLSPSLAALFMVLSSLFVIANSRRLGEFECDRSSNPIRTAVKPSEDHRAGEIASESSPLQPKADRSITRFESARMPQAVSIDQHSFTLPTPGRPC